MHFSITELLLIAFIVLILFGTKKLRNMGGDLGSALRDFKKAMHEEPKENSTAPKPTAEPEQLADAQFHADSDVTKPKSAADTPQDK
jgi:sec-independent protein translocase protein TatA